MRDRNEERFHGLAAQVPAGFVDHGARNHQRHSAASFREGIGDGEQRSLAVERVENGFDDEKIDTTFEQRLGLIEIGLAQADRTRPREMQDRLHQVKWRQRQEAAHRSANESPLTGFIRDPIRRMAGDPRRFEINFTNQRAKTGVLDHALKNSWSLRPAVGSP